LGEVERRLNENALVEVARCGPSLLLNFFDELRDAPVEAEIAHNSLIGNVLIG
jgi:hypothetical protein